MTLNMYVFDLVLRFLDTTHREQSTDQIRSLYLKPFHMAIEGSKKFQK